MMGECRSQSYHISGGLHVKLPALYRRNTKQWSEYTSDYFFFSLIVPTKNKQLGDGIRFQMAGRSSNGPSFRLTLHWRLPSVRLFACDKKKLSLMWRQTMSVCVLCAWVCQWVWWCWFRWLTWRLITKHKIFVFGKYHADSAHFTSNYRAHYHQRSHTMWQFQTQYTYKIRSATRWMMTINFFCGAFIAQL